MPRVTTNNLVIFTDLDGTLLDHDTFSWAAAKPALDALKRRNFPLVFVSSKTRAEVMPVLRALGRRDPFVVENGGAIFLPAGYFPFRVRRITPGPRGWEMLALGTARRRLLVALSEAARRANVRIRGFGEMSAREVSELTNLDRAGALRALAREYDEPFIILHSNARAWPRLRAEIRRLGLNATRGSRFFHILGENDKGAAVRRLIHWFVRLKGPEVRVVGLGDSPNDVPMLRAVDVSILVARPRGRYDAETLAAVPNARRAGGAGPEGWNRAVLRLCERDRN